MIYLVIGSWDYEGSEVIVATTSKEKAQKIAKENSKPWHYDEQDKVDRYHYDRIGIEMWKNEERVNELYFWGKDET